MHELSVTEGILSTVLAAAEQAAARRVVAIDLVIGDLTGIVPDSIQFYFDLLSQNTIAASAQLRFRREPATAKCNACGHHFEASLPLLPLCPACGSPRLEVTGGRRLQVESIEIDGDKNSSDDQDLGSAEHS